MIWRNRHAGSISNAGRPREPHLPPSLFDIKGCDDDIREPGALLLNLEGLATNGDRLDRVLENADRRLLAGAAAILAGARVLSWSGDGVRLDIGSVLIAAACLCWGIDNNLTGRRPLLSLTAEWQLSAGGFNRSSQHLL
ncbi:hypothetical protein GCM10010862_39190 [Devosia nitrariae]|uniref:Uncharacterized protein n=1 Tax=Devosia nitrariae TaxID=2071872 RepID=A0ABQ5W976_9HYPH|nr:hypothetical protein GCM10010862_39190 [Devosia nitrariae]